MNAKSMSINASESSVLSSDTQRDWGCTTPDEDDALVIARTLLHPEVGAAVTLAQYGKSGGDLELLALVEALAEATRASSKGNLGRGEAMLTAQAHVLDALFNSLARRAAMNIGEYLGATETYLKLALRAQSQCRATWETLATIKNPPVAGYVQQANIAHGPQQVNNGVASRTRETEIGPNKQSGAESELLPDAGASQAESRIDPQMDAVGEVHRPENAGR